MFKKLLFGIVAITALFHSKSKAQISDSSSGFDCKLPVSFIESMTIDSPGHGASSAITLPASFPVAAIDTCGKFRIFYADAELAPGTGIYKGFADATLGTTRRNTMCAALNYIQSRIDFSSLADSEYVRLYVDTSCSSAFPAGKHYISGFSMYSFLAIASPYHAPMGPGDTVNGFVHDFITSGTDPNMGDYHGYLKMNFDSGYIPSTPRPILYNNGLGDPDCTEFDLFSVLTHYVTHTMGWFSWSDSLHTGVGSLGHYTNYDLSLHKTPWMKLAVNPFASITKVFPSSPVFAADYWVNGKLPPDNYPVESASPSHLIGGFHRGGSSMSYYYNRVSPGESFDHLMGGAFHQGAKKRVLLKGDWETLHDNIGYNYNGSFAADSAVVIANHLPHSVKMGADTMNRLFYFYFVQSMPEYIPADYSIKNDVGTSVTINLNSLTDLQDADGDSISIYPGSIVNFRGCGTGGNNHNLLSVSNSGKTITYTPRANFYGRAQFGINLYDQKEKGGFVVFTVDVTKGNNVSVSTGDNMALNGDFEEGSEVKTNDTNLHIPNSVFRRLELSQHMSDSHPYEYSNAHFGTAIRNSYKACLITPYTLYDFGHEWNVLNFSGSYFGGTYTAPNPYLGVGNRYQPIATHPATFYLADTLLSCHRYLLEFDAVRTLSDDTVVFAYPKYDSIIIGFGRDTFFNPTNRLFYTTMKPYPTDSITVGTWKHFSIPFTYCRDSSANILTLYIKGLNGYAPPQIIDNVSLKATTEPLSFKLKDTSIGTCSRRLFSDLYDLGCSSFSYEWRKLGDATVIATTASIDVSNTTENSYILSISDGCSTGYDTITLAPCPCSVGAVFGATIDSILPSTLSTSLSSGFYHLTANLTVSGSPTFSNAIILIEPDVKITVDNDAFLTLDNCHLLTCPDTNKLWEGIELASSAGISGRIEVKNNSLIEDAEIAIKAVNPLPSATMPAGDFIKTDSSVFNRNFISIWIENYNSTAMSAYPFKFTNTVFTSRDLDTFRDYPNVWPRAGSLTLTYNCFTASPTTCTDARPPYLLDREYEKILLKDGKVCGDGIHLTNVGYSYTAPPNYYEIVIGEATDTSLRNMFDNMLCGIYATNSNLTAYNNAFINIRSLPTATSTYGFAGWNGMGIASFSDNGNQHRMRVLGEAVYGNTVLRNLFYDCRIGIFAQGLWSFTATKNLFQTSNTTPSLGIYAPRGNYQLGIFAHSKRFEVNQIEENLMYNVPIGIQVHNLHGSGFSFGQNNIVGNRIYQQAPSPFTHNAAYYVYQGISLSANGFWLGTTGAATGNNYISSNNMIDVNNGIAVNGQNKMKSDAINNYIELSNNSKAQYAFNYANSYKGHIAGNSIYGKSGAASNDKARGFYASMTQDMKICDNYVRDIGRGFDFANTRAQTGTLWTNNRMENNRNGFVLGSDIGPQSTPTLWTFPPSSLILASNNVWVGGSGAWTGGKNQTFVDYNSTAGAPDVMNSILYVRASPADEYPTVNSALPPTFRYKTSGSPLSVQNTATTLATCYDYSGIAMSVSPLSHLLVADTLGYGSGYYPAQWMGQLAQYQAGRWDTDLSDSSASFTRFMSVATGSRFEWLTNIEDALANGDTTTAQGLLASPVSAAGRVVIDPEVVITDYTAADYVVDNYTTFYEVYLHYLTGQFSSNDTTQLNTLSLMCPARDGAVVHQARAFYDYLLQTHTVYDDDSCIANGQSTYRLAPNSEVEGGKQSYSLFPNPNVGSFVLKQNIPLNQNIPVKVYDALGRMVYSCEHQFKDGKTNVRLLNAISGLYLVCIGDAMANNQCIKFTVK
ncbi:MAG: T9SS type A sorting domain-containing protein [Bacteroidota bacterium]